MNSAIDPIERLVKRLVAKEILTPEQKAKADKARDDWKKRQAEKQPEKK